MSAPFMTVSPSNSRTDPETGLRYYTWKGVEYPSVTSLRNLAGMPMNLAAWYRRMTIERAVIDYEKLGELIASGGAAIDPKTGKMKGPAFTWLWNAPNDASAKARELGSLVHDAASRNLRVDQVPKDVGDILIQYRKWLEDSGAEVLLAERQVWNTYVGYAGTFDLIARFPKSKAIYMIDLKTGSGTYPEHAMQTEAYCRAEFVGNSDVVDDDATRILREVNGRAILHLRPEGWSFKTIRPDKWEDLWVAFNGLLSFARWSSEVKSIDDLVQHRLGTLT